MTFLKNTLDGTASGSKIFKRNILKESLQVYTLDYIYSSPVYSHLIFYGGSCLSHCFGLPRLSEDLDFVDVAGKVNLAQLAGDLEAHFKKEGIGVKATVQKFRIYLKFPILRELGLAGTGESDQLFLKVEVFGNFTFCKKYKTEIVPLFKLNKTILILTFDMPTLMATKIRAVLWRKWEKTDKAGRTIAKVKGRDYFDLMWYMEKGVMPNIDCLDETADLSKLKARLIEAVGKIDERSISLDLEPLISDAALVKRLSSTIKDILIRKIGEWQ